MSNHLFFSKFKLVRIHECPRAGSDLLTFSFPESSQTSSWITEQTIQVLKRSSAQRDGGADDESLLHGAFESFWFVLIVGRGVTGVSSSACCSGKLSIREAGNRLWGTWLWKVFCFSQMFPPSHDRLCFFSVSEAGLFSFMPAALH